MAAVDDLRVLVVDFASTGAAHGRALSFSVDEQHHWLRDAARRSVALVALVTPGRVELYSFGADHRAARRSTIEDIASCVAGMPELGRSRAVELGGQAAARHLLQRAAGLELASAGDVRVLMAIHTATAQSAASGTLAPPLADLFRAATTVGHRVRQETALADPRASESVRELESFAAARVVEEELSGWLVACLKQSLAPNAGLPSFRPSFAPAQANSIFRFKGERPSIRTLVS